MATHTPGPWEVGMLDHNGQRIVRQEHIEICTCWHHCVGSIEKEMEANARLIAASPEMLAALKQVCAWKDAITLLAPELGGLLTAIYHAEAVATKAEA